MVQHAVKNAKHKLPRIIDEISASEIYSDWLPAAIKN